MSQVDGSAVHALPALGRLEDLPQEYRDELTKQNLVPLWPSLRAVLPPGIPSRRTQATSWSYQALRPLLLKAGELTPMEKAERRVLVLANPGRGLENMQASPSIYLGMQLLLPGERAPSHRHTPNAIRMVIEGAGASTIVDGEDCPMARGDLILTPTGMWHEHIHAGSEPVVWLDVLDLPLIYYSETSYVIEGSIQPVNPHPVSPLYAAGVVPAPNFHRSKSNYPILRYPYNRTRESLLALAENPKVDAVIVTFTNPETGAPTENNLGFHALLLRPSQTLRLPIRSTPMVFHTIEGSASASISGASHTLEESDTVIAPGYTEITLTNKASAPTILFVCDEEPIQRKMGTYEVRESVNVPNMP